MSYNVIFQAPSSGLVLLITRFLWNIITLKARPVLAPKRHTAVTACLKSKQLLLFAFAELG